MMNFQKVLKTYIIGFLLSIVLTLLAYGLVQIHVNSMHETIPHTILIPTIICIALIQLLVQLIFFLHLGQKNSKWNVVFFIITFTAVVLVIIASIWIMNHLDYNMTPTQMMQYIKDQSSF